MVWQGNRNIVNSSRRYCVPTRVAYAIGGGLLLVNLGVAHTLFMFMLNPQR